MNIMQQIRRRIFRGGRGASEERMSCTKETCTVSENRSKRQSNTQKKQASGQTLFETMVALGLIMMGVVTLVVLVGRAIGLSRVVADRFTATYLAAEGIEVVKSLIDTNVLRSASGCSWTGGGAGCVSLAAGTYDVDPQGLALIPASGNPLWFDSINRLYSPYAGGASTPTNFIRTVELISLRGGDELQVTAKVRWVSRGGSYDIILEDHFFNWQ